MEIQQEVDLRPYNSFGVSAIAAEFAEVLDPALLPELYDYADQEQLPVFLLGGGSNVLWVNDYPGLVLYMANRGVQFDEVTGRVQAAAGENWHNLVTSCMQNGFHGLENLALIPGSVGAAPVQNIGAYGVELERYVVRVSVYDRVARSFRSLDRASCQFAYRDSLFKQAQGRDLVITGVELQLDKHWQPVLDYPALREALPSASPTAREVYDTVCTIRSSKLPDPAVLGNAGSFFKNPLVSRDKYKKLLKKYPSIPCYETDDAELVKIPAAWLLDCLGWKGRSRGAAAVHEHHALVLVNPGAARGEDVYLLAQQMSSSVLSEFGIALQPEVRIL